MENKSIFQKKRRRRSHNNTTAAPLTLLAGATLKSDRVETRDRWMVPHLEAASV